MKWGERVVIKAGVGDSNTTLGQRKIIVEGVFH